MESHLSRLLFAGQQWRHRHRKQTCGHSGGRMDREKSVETYITMCKVDTEGGSGGRGHMYLCGCFLLMYGRSYPLLGKFKKTTEKDKVKNKQCPLI